MLPVPDTVSAEIEKIIKTFIWGGSPPKVSRKQMRRPKDEGGLDGWDIECKFRALQANWILKYVCDELSGSLEGVIQELVWKWANTSPTRHLLNDPDDNREWCGSRPIAECIFAWSKIVKYAPELKAGQFVAILDRKVHPGKGIEESQPHNEGICEVYLA